MKLSKVIIDFRIFIVHDIRSNRPLNHGFGRSSRQNRSCHTQICLGTTFNQKMMYLSRFRWRKCPKRVKLHQVIIPFIRVLRFFLLRTYLIRIISRQSPKQQKTTEHFETNLKIMFSGVLVIKIGIVSKIVHKS